MPTIICPRCDPPDQDILTADRVSKLCEKCGKFMIRIDAYLPKDQPVKAQEEETVEPETEEGTAVDGPEKDGDQDLEELTVVHLREIAKELKILNYWDITKKKLIAKIRKAQAKAQK